MFKLDNGKVVRVRGDPFPPRYVYEEYERQKRELCAIMTDNDLYETKCREIAEQLGI